jgi:hypothetical protein
VKFNIMLVSIYGGGGVFSFLSMTLVDGRTVRVCASARKEIGVNAAF